MKKYIAIDLGATGGRVILASVSDDKNLRMETLQEIAPSPIDALHITGGCKNDLLNQMTADACGVRVVAGPSEGTALGNVMVQAGLSRKELLNSIETKIFNNYEQSLRNSKRTLCLTWN